MLDLVNSNIYKNDELKHWGILGMKWGIRRFQNPDGTLTPEGRERYGVKTVAETKKLSYSQKLSVLRNKQNLTDKEKKQLENLEKGREYILKTKTTNLALTKENIKNGKLASDYLMSTNYGKKVTLYQFLGGPIISSNFALANENDFIKELGSENEKSDTKKVDSKIHELLIGNNDPNKTFNDDAKNLGFKSSLELISKKFTKSVKDSDIKNHEDIDLSEAKKMLSKFGLSNKDLVQNDEGFIVRKDGKDFDFDYYGKRVHERDLDSAFKNLMAGGKIVEVPDIGKLNSDRKAPNSSYSITDQRDDYYSKNYGKIFNEIVNKLEKQGYDVYVDSIDGYAWINDKNGPRDFSYNGRKYNEVDELVIDILNEEFNKKYG